jgi:recombination associated protein RdgC
MFKNLFIYRLKNAQLLPTSIEEALSRAAFLSCAPTQATSCGWVAPRGLEHAELVEQQGQQR